MAVIGNNIPSGIEKIRINGQFPKEKMNLYDFSNTVIVDNPLEIEEDLRYTMKEGYRCRLKNGNDLYVYQRKIYLTKNNEILDQKNIPQYTIPSTNLQNGTNRYYYKIDITEQNNIYLIINRYFQGSYRTTRLYYSVYQIDIDNNNKITYNAKLIEVGLDENVTYHELFTVPMAIATDHGLYMGITRQYGSGIDYSHLGIYYINYASINNNVPELISDELEYETPDNIYRDREKYFQLFISNNFKTISCGGIYDGVGTISVTYSNNSHEKQRNNNNILGAISHLDGYQFFIFNGNSYAFRNHNHGNDTYFTPQLMEFDSTSNQFKLKQKFKKAHLLSLFYFIPDYGAPEEIFYGGIRYSSETDEYPVLTNENGEIEIIKFPPNQMSSWTLTIKIPEYNSSHYIWKLYNFNYNHIGLICHFKRYDQISGEKQNKILIQNAQQSDPILYCTKDLNAIL